MDSNKPKDFDKGSMDQGYGVLRVTSLTKSYRKRLILDNISMKVDSGETYGLVGPNGAGKTTLVSCLAGLTKPDFGEISILGQPLKNSADLVGVAFEDSAFYPHLSARSNLTKLARLAGLETANIGDLLRRVRLEKDAKKRVGNYSLGMKTRLGLAAALLKEPRLLIMDEPTNGLDPPGTLLMRELLGDLTREGISVLFSSHALDEVEKLADRAGIIKQGVLVAQDSPEKLLHRDSSVLWVKALPLQTAQEVLEHLHSVKKIEVISGELQVSANGDVSEHEIREKLVERGAEVVYINKQTQRGLEDWFSE